MASKRQMQAHRLLREYRDGGNTRAREQLVRLYLPLLRGLAYRYGHRGEQLEDVTQIAAIGLLHAIERFDPDKGAFEAFAVTTVIGELRRHYRDRGWPVRVPRRLQDARRALDAPGAELAGRLARAPTSRELAREAGAAEDDVLAALEAERLRTTVSLSAPTPFEHAELLSFEANAAEEAAERCDERLLVASCLRRLDRRARQIVHLRFFEGLSQAQIARELQLSQIHVSRLLRDALATLRRHMAPV